MSTFDNLILIHFIYSQKSYIIDTKDENFCFEIKNNNNKLSSGSSLDIDLTTNNKLISDDIFYCQNLKCIGKSYCLVSNLQIKKIELELDIILLNKNENIEQHHYFLSRRKNSESLIKYNLLNLFWTDNNSTLDLWKKCFENIKQLHIEKYFNKFRVIS